MTYDADTYARACALPVRPYAMAGVCCTAPLGEDEDGAGDESDSVEDGESCVALGGE